MVMGLKIWPTLGLNQNRSRRVPRGTLFSLSARNQVNLCRQHISPAWHPTPIQPTVDTVPRRLFDTCWGVAWSLARWLGSIDDIMFWDLNCAEEVKWVSHNDLISSAEKPLKTRINHFVSYSPMMSLFAAQLFQPLTCTHSESFCDPCALRGWLMKLCMTERQTEF